MGNILNLILFLLILGISIMIHELGHFLFAKRAGIYCHEFALGMGPKLKSWKKGETEYSIRAIPLGGFVSMAGEGYEEDKNVPEDRVFQAQSWIERFLAVFAGPLFNFILAFVIILGVGLFTGVPNNKNVIGEVMEGYSASEAGLEAGDIITSVNGVSVTTWDELLELIGNNKEDEPIEITYQRDGETFDTVLEPMFIEEYQRYMIGIEPSMTRNPLKVIAYSVQRVIYFIGYMFRVISGLITGLYSTKDISGFVGIYGMVGQQAEAGIVSLLNFLAFLSINLGFMNLLPIPGLDGGRIIFLLLELILGKGKITPKVENYIHVGGMFLLFGFLIYVTVNDVLKTGIIEKIMNLF